jgi:hypothetical protein
VILSENNETFVYFIWWFVMEIRWSLKDLIVCYLKIFSDSFQL